MSKVGLVLLLLSVALGAVLVLDVAAGRASSTLLVGVFSLCLTASAIALALGRRVKFDPILR